MEVPGSNPEQFVNVFSSTYFYFSKGLSIMPDSHVWFISLAITLSSGRPSWVSGVSTETPF